MLKSRKTAKRVWLICNLCVPLHTKRVLKVMKKKDLAVTADAVSSLQDIMQMLSPQEQEELKDNIAIQYFKKNETLYQEGEVPQMFHCLISGKVKIYKDGIGGRTQIVRVIKPV